MRCAAALLVSLLPIASCGRSEESAQREPEVPPPARTARHLLLVTVDTLRADHLGFLGGRPGVSPTLDELARRGVWFRDAHAPTGMTLASVTTLMTSKPPDETGVLTNVHVVRPEERTLAERLAEVGFRCRAWVANGVLRAGASGIDQGFEELRRVDEEGYLTHLAAEWIVREFGKDPARRDFVWIHYMDPHQPYQPREPWITQFAGEEEPPIGVDDETLRRIYVEKLPLSEEQIEYIRAVYDSQIRRVDTFVRSILAALDMAGRTEDTLVVFTADHGEELYDHFAYFYHANSLYSSVTHVPLVFRLPGVLPEGKVVDGLASLADVLPTILRLLGVPAQDEDPATLPRGRDLWPAMLRGATSRPFVVSQVVDRIYAIRDRRHTLVLNPTRFQLRSVPEEGDFPIPERALYVRDEDPLEQRDAFAERTDVARRLAAVLAAWRRNLTKVTPVRQEIDQQSAEELHQLGYVTGDDD